MSGLEYQIHLVSSVVCQIFHPSCQVYSCCQWNVTNYEVCEGMSHFISAKKKSVCNWSIVAQQSVSLSCMPHPICIVNARNTNILASVMSGSAENPRQDSQVTVEAAVSLHHQQNDNFYKIQKENAKWTSAVNYVWCFNVLLSSGVPCVNVHYTSLRERGECQLQGC